MKKLLVMMMVFWAGAAAAQDRTVKIELNSIALRNSVCQVFIRGAPAHPLPPSLQVIIEGFKSYKDQTVSESFSPGVNVVGRRGGRASREARAWLGAAGATARLPPPPTPLLSRRERVG